MVASTRGAYTEDLETGFSAQGPALACGDSLKGGKGWPRAHDSCRLF